MNSEMLKRLAVKGIVAYVAVFSLVLLVAMPAVAMLAANLVDSAAIIDGQVKSKDIGQKAVKTKHLAPRAVKSRQIAKNAVRGIHIRKKSVPDSKIKYSTKTKRLALPAAAFQPVNNVNYANMGLGMYSTPGSVIAPVSLPDGAKVTELSIIAIDASATANLQATLRGYNYITKANLPMGGPLSTSGTSSDWQQLIDNTISNPVIDNTTNSYMIVVTTAEYLVFGRALITYEVTGP